MGGMTSENGNHLPASFQLDTDSLTNPRTRFTSTNRKDTHAMVHVQFRCDEFNNRRIEEILAARIDPAIRTKSDVFQDAVHLWLMEWDTRNPDGANGILRAQSHVRLMQLERQIRNDFLTTVEQELDELRQDGDIRRLDNLLQQLCNVKTDSEKAPPSYIDRLDKLIVQTTRLIEANQ